MTTVAVYLGVNRSLTTISSAMFALHPQMTVLNHAFIRIFEDGSKDFLRDPDQAKLDAFVEAAGEMALGGEQGAVGGHILHSHAFADQALRGAYLDRFGPGAKPASSTLVWKDATRVTNHMIGNGITPADVAARLPSLRFIMMVRNPVDITISSIRKGYSTKLVGEERRNDFGEVFTHVVKLFDWFAKSASVHPDQFRFIYQDELLDPERLRDLCGFLDVSPDPEWLGDVARLVGLRPSYPIGDEQRANLRSAVRRLIANSAVAGRVADQIV